MQAEQSSRVGLLTDIHYDGSITSMNRLNEAVAVFNQGGVDALVVMGDLIHSNGERNGLRLLREVSALCESFRGTIHYMPGNHDLEHLSKAQFYSALDRPQASSRFHFRQGEYGFICIDGNFSPDGSEYDHGNFQWKESFLPEEQLDWLREQLEALPFPLIVLFHQRVDSPGTHSVKNDAAVREVIQQSGKVSAVFQGHQHAADLKELDGTAYYTLSAHKDDAGSAVIELDAQGLRLIRDFQPLEAC